MIPLKSFPDDIQDLCIVEISAKYMQDSDGMDTDQMQDLKIEIANCGDDPYFVISTRRWAFNDISELIKVLKDFEKRLK